MMSEFILTMIGTIFMLALAFCGVGTLFEGFNSLIASDPKEKFCSGKLFYKYLFSLSSGMLFYCLEGRITTKLEHGWFGECFWICFMVISLLGWLEYKKNESGGNYNPKEFENEKEKINRA